MKISELIKEYQPGEGRHFFDRDTMAFFASKVEQARKGKAGTFFVTSEKSCFNGPARRYSVRQLVEPGKIDTVGGFGAYDSLGDAVVAMTQLSNGVEVTV